MPLQLISQPANDESRLGDILIENFHDERWHEFSAGVAFARFSGVKHISNAISEFCRRGKVKLSIGADLGGTSKEALLELLAAIDNNGEIWIFHNASNYTFHPKMYSFKNDHEALLVVGSGNLTEGGLFTNYEISLATSLDLQNQNDNKLFLNAESLLSGWCDASNKLALKLDETRLEELVNAGIICLESKINQIQKIQRNIVRSGSDKKAEGIFGKVTVPPAPRQTKTLTEKPTAKLIDANLDVTTNINKENEDEITGFLMALQKTDVGVGQTHSDTSRRSPEIFIPLTARDYSPNFWGWPDKFIEDKLRAGKFDRHGVRFRLGPTIVNVNMMTWPVKHDFRLRSEALRSAGEIGDILRLEKSTDLEKYDFYAEIIPKGSSDFDKYSALCVNKVRNSKKTFGYY